MEVRLCQVEGQNLHLPAQVRAEAATFEQLATRGKHAHFSTFILTEHGLSLKINQAALFRSL